MIYRYIKPYAVCSPVWKILQESAAAEGEGESEGEGEAGALPLLSFVNILSSNYYKKKKKRKRKGKKTLSS